MASSDYITAAGFIQQFGKDKPAVVERTLDSGKTIRDITLKVLGTQKLVRVTVWPEHAHVPLEAGQFVAVDGTYEVRKGDNGTEFFNLSCGSIATLPVIRRQSDDRPQAAPAAAPSQNAGPGDDGIPF